MECDVCKKPGSESEHECVRCNAGMCNECFRSCDYCEEYICLKHTVDANGVDACHRCADALVD